MTYHYFKCTLCPTVLKTKTFESRILADHLRDKHPNACAEMHEADRKYHEEVAKLDKLYGKMMLGFWFKKQEGVR